MTTTTARKQTPEQFEADVTAAVDCLINAQDCFRQSQKFPMYSETRKSWQEREAAYQRDYMKFRPKVRKAAYERFDTARNWIMKHRPAAITASEY